MCQGPECVVAAAAAAISRAELTGGDPEQLCSEQLCPEQVYLDQAYLEQVCPESRWIQAPGLRQRGKAVLEFWLLCKSVVRVLNNTVCFVTNCVNFFS